MYYLYRWCLYMFKFVPIWYIMLSDLWFSEPLASMNVVVYHHLNSPSVVNLSVHPYSISLTQSNSGIICMVYQDYVQGGWKNFQEWKILQEVSTSCFLSTYDPRVYTKEQKTAGWFIWIILIHLHKHVIT